MDDLATDCAAIFEATSFLSHFNELPDPRQAVKVVYPLDEVLLLSLLAVLAGAETVTDIARFGDKKLALLRRFRPFLNGTPRMIASAISSPPSMPNTSSVASSPGWLR